MNLIKNSDKLFRNLKLQNLIKVSNCKLHMHENFGTVVELISQNQDVRYIKTVSNYGFRLNNYLFAVGPIVIFNEVLLSWNIRSVEEINPSSLSLFRMFVPKFEILILGVGDKVENLHPHLIPYLSRNKVPYEIHRTKDAAKLYNSMILDRRNVAAALIPPRKVGDELRDSVGSGKWEELYDARNTHLFHNEVNLSRMILKHQENLMYKFKTKYIAKSDLQAMIAAKNQAEKEAEKKVRFKDIIKEEVKAIKEEEMMHLEGYTDEDVIDSREEKSKFEGEIDPNRKLLK